MRDYQTKTFRTAMSWVHAWGGLLFGWLLFAVFVTGSLSFFRQEITVWMQPEIQHAHMTEKGLTRALSYLEETAPDAAAWNIRMPDSRYPVMQLSYGEDGRRFRGEQTVMDPASGDILQPRATAGGDFLYHFHYQLYGLGRSAGEWIVGIATMIMFVVLITGIIVHRQIFKDFFTFRPAKDKRSWLDAHNLSAVLGTPFFIVITLSGLILLGTRVMPAAEWGAYAGSGSSMRADIKGQGEKGKSGIPGGEGGWQGGHDGGREKGRMARDSQVQGERPWHADGGRPPGRSGLDADVRGGRGGTADGGDSVIRRPPAARMAMVDLQFILDQAQSIWPLHGVARITVRHPHSAAAEIEIRQSGSSILSDRGMGGSLVFNGITGELQQEKPAEKSAVKALFSSLQAIHLGIFSLPLARWLLFLSGVGGSLMIASGLVLWVVTNNQKKARNGDGKTIGNRLVEILNTAAIGGLLLALTAYFWANRLLPAALENRQQWEINVFFIVWLMSLLQAALASHKTAWQVQLTGAGVMAALLPLVNALTGGAHLGVSIGLGQLQVALFDLVALFSGLALLYTAYRVRHFSYRSKTIRG